MLPEEEIKKRLSYDPCAGILIWKRCDSMPKKWNTRWAGKKAGSINGQGYVVVRVYRKLYPAHRIAWALKTGSWPSKEIDHKNGNRSDNRWENLREASRVENSRNMKMTRRNKSGHTGVFRQRGKWRAQIKIKEKYLFLGYFDKKEEAIEARKKAEEEYFGEFRPDGG